MKVLIAIDEKRFAKPILDYMLKHKWDSNTEFLILHVYEPLLVGSYLSILPAPLLEQMQAEQKADGETLARSVALKLRDALKSPYIKERVTAGLVPSAIASVALEEAVDLVVVGSHGRHGFDRLVHGSVSLALAESMPCSVLVVHAPPTEDADNQELAGTAEAK